MNRPLPANRRGQKTVCVLAVATILALSWFKAAENQRDIENQEAWRHKMDVLQIESQKEGERLGRWFSTISSQPDARQRIENELTGGDPLPVIEKQDRYDIVKWVHLKYGIQASFTFFGNKLVSNGLSYGTGQLQSVSPRPPQLSRTGRAELIRQRLTSPLVAVWLVALIVAVLPMRFGQVAAEVMLVSALACGAAWLVSPWYTLTVHGIFSNDRLFFPLLMYLVSIVLLAFHTSRQRPAIPIRFSLRTIMLITAVVAVLMAIGPLGYVATAVFAIGGTFYLCVLQTLHILLKRTSADGSVHSL